MDTPMGPSSPVGEFRNMAAAIGFWRLCVLASIFGLRIRHLRDSEASKPGCQGVGPGGGCFHPVDGRPQVIPPGPGSCGH